MAIKVLDPKKKLGTGAPSPVPVNTDYGTNLNMTSPTSSVTPTGSDKLNGTDITYEVRGGSGGIVSGGGGTTSTNIGKTDEVLEYEEFIKPKDENSQKIDNINSALKQNALDIKNNSYGYADNLKAMANDEKKTAYERAAELRARAEKEAEIARERDIVDARSSYEQNKATYGANAEALASMGLTSSGYSDHLDAAAYATQRAEIQGANARSEAAKRAASDAEADAQFAADTTYNTNLREAEGVKFAADQKYSEDIANIDASYKQGLDDAYYEIYDLAKSGNYTNEEIYNLAIRRGLDGESAASLQSVAIGTENKTAEKEKQTQAANSAQILAGLGDDIGAIKANIESGAISKEQGEAQIKTIQTENKNIFAGAIRNAASSRDIGSVDMYVIKEALDVGKISPEAYSDLLIQFNSAFKSERFAKGSETAFKDVNGGYMTRSAALAYLETCENNEFLDNPNKTTLRKMFNEMYATYSSTSIYNSSGSLEEYADTGNDFNVKANGKTMHVESAGEVTGEEAAKLLAVAENYKDNWIFGYNGKIYVKHSGRIFRIQGQGGNKTNGYYETLYNAIFKETNNDNTKNTKNNDQTNVISTVLDKWKNLK